MLALDGTTLPITLQGLWKVVHQDLDNRNQLMDIINNLSQAEKIQAVEGGYLPIKKVLAKGIAGLIDWNLLTQAERGLL